MVALLDATTLVVVPEPKLQLSMNAARNLQAAITEALPGYHCLVFADGGEIRDFRGDAEATRLAEALRARLVELEVLKEVAA